MKMDKKKKRRIIQTFQKQKQKRKTAAYQARDGDSQGKEEAKPQQENSQNVKEKADPIAEKSVNRPDEGFTDRNRGCRILRSIKFRRRHSTGYGRKELCFYTAKFQRQNRRMRLLKGLTKQSRERKTPILL